MNKLDTCYLHLFLCLNIYKSKHSKSTINFNADEKFVNLIPDIEFVLVSNAQSISGSCAQCS